MKNITPKQVKELIDSGKDFLLIDVRTAEEYKAGHVAIAVNIPLTEIASALELTEAQFKKKYGKALTKKTMLVFCCRSGGRSMHAALYAERFGYSPYNMAGGMMDWQSIEPKIKIL